MQGTLLNTANAVGVDACAGGWVAVALTGRRVERVWFETTLGSLLADVPEGTTIGIDLPLGGVNAGWRTADVAARKLLGAQGSSVFLVPPRSVWDEKEYAAANARCRELTGQGLSRQAYGLIRRMLEAEEFRDRSGHHMIEVHPELVFRALAGEALRYRKRTWNGQMQRRRLLAGARVTLSDHLPQAGKVPADDVLDAAAVAWCAFQVAAGSSRHVPDPAHQHDHRNRPIVIHY